MNKNKKTVLIALAFRLVVLIYEILMVIVVLIYTIPMLLSQKLRNRWLPHFLTSIHDKLNNYVPEERKEEI